MKKISITHRLLIIWLVLVTALIAFIAGAVSMHAIGVDLLQVISVRAGAAAVVAFLMLAGWGLALGAEIEGNKSLFDCLADEKTTLDQKKEALGTLNSGDGWRLAGVILMSSTGAITLYILLSPIVAAWFGQ